MDRQGRWCKIYIFCYLDVNGFVALQQFTTAGNWSTKTWSQLGHCGVPDTLKGVFSAELLLTGSLSRFTAQSKYWSPYFLHAITRRTEAICSTDHFPPHTWLSHLHNKLIIQSCIFTMLSLQPTCSPTCCQNRHPPLPESVRHVSSPTHAVPLSSIHTPTLSACNNYLQLWEGALQIFIPALPLTAHSLHHRTCPKLEWNFALCISLSLYTCCPRWLPKGWEGGRRVLPSSLTWYLLEIE